MTYEEHMKLASKMSNQWNKENYKEPSVRKALKYIAAQKKRRGIL
jgi:hypothetical protein